MVAEAMRGADIMKFDWKCLALSLILTTSSLSLSLDTNAHQDGDLKLVDGPLPTMGTVLVFRSYGWGRICDDHWTMKEAQVVCRQLKMGYALEANRRNHYGSRISGAYLMDEVRCTGAENRITDCQFAGWGIHDCKQNEEVGVKCAYEAPIVQRSATNPLSLKLKESELIRMRSVGITLKKPRLPSDVSAQADVEIASFYPVIVTLEDGTAGSVCPDHFHGAEAIVFCNQMGLGTGGRVIPMPQHHTGLGANTSVAIIGRCYGNETQLSQCVTYADPNGVPCDSPLAAAVECTKYLPDLIPDRYSLESSAYLQKMSLWLLECALEENCLPDTVYRIIDRNPTSYAWMTRTLLRFSSIIENIGTDVFRPLEEPENWEWHACHMHYHSMKVFSRYEVVDPENRLVSVGLKASFCLEDNLCRSGVVPHFRCSNVVDSKGTQGISPGCKDMYLHDYDCQWVDVTDITPGKYTFQVSFNPDFLVPESNYFNNALTCELTHMGHQAVLRQCRHVHPNDLI
ncbi:Lysyl oxidase 2B [Clonorchis sinensis]|uniref:Lysyl oxidase 2B n=1 Tax=Clonorchis sinensis TaxID=79923 RepID=A0A8T1MIH7_CLOSI|nr:Lysyl oxidase 2B [Clonorchis sinensis]